MPSSHNGSGKARLKHLNASAATEGDVRVDGDSDAQRKPLNSYAQVACYSKILTTISTYSRSRRMWLRPENIGVPTEEILEPNEASRPQNKNSKERPHMLFGRPKAARGYRRHTRAQTKNARARRGHRHADPIAAQCLKPLRSRISAAHHRLMITNI